MVIIIKHAAVVSGRTGLLAGDVPLPYTLSLVVDLDINLNSQEQDTVFTFLKCYKGHYSKSCKNKGRIFWEYSYTISNVPVFC